MSENRIQKDAESRVGRHAIHRYVQSTMDCENTKLLFPSGCPKDTFLVVKSAMPGASDLIAKFDSLSLGSGTRIGKFDVRAKCGDDSQLVVEARRVDVADDWKDVNINSPLNCKLKPDVAPSP